MTVREPLPAPDRSRRPGPKGKVGERPDPLPGPSDAAPARAAALSGEVGRRRQPQPGKMFSVESAERVELCESLLTWVRSAGPGRPPAPPGRLSGVPPSARPGGRVPRTAVPSHPGPGAGGAGEGWGGRVFTRSRAGVGGRRGGAGHGRLRPGSEDDFPGGRCGPGGG